MNYDMAYIGVKPCGCSVAIVNDDPGSQADVAADLSRFILNGYAVERVTWTEGMRRLTHQCEHVTQVAK